LGTKIGFDGFLPFEEARTFVRSLNIKNIEEWDNYNKSGKKPNNIPNRPMLVYKKEWLSLGDWLGTKIGFNGFLPFEEARTFVRSLNLKNQKEWNNYRKSENKPNNIPSDPTIAYKKEWLSLGDWLGTYNIAKQNKYKNYLSYNEAKIFIRNLGIKSVNEYYNWWYENKPNFLPKHIDRYYKNNF
jgi:hypothetical protein